jgi:signal transduction histidine kinase
MLVIAPIGLTLTRKPTLFTERHRVRVEFICLIASALIVETYAFSQNEFFALFLVEPFFVWAAVRLGVRFVGIVTVVTATCVLSLTVQADQGPIVALYPENVERQVPFAQLFLAALSLPALLLAANVTDHRRVEKALRIMADRLESRVARRSEELRKSNERALSNERFAAIGRIAATVSHELRSPLGTIDSSLNYLRFSASGRRDKEVRALKRAERNITQCMPCCCGRSGRPRTSFDQHCPGR